MNGCLRRESNVLIFCFEWVQEKMTFYVALVKPIGFWLPHTHIRIHSNIIIAANETHPKASSVWRGAEDPHKPHTQIQIYLPILRHDAPLAVVIPPYSPRANPNRFPRRNQPSSSLTHKHTAKHVHRKHRQTETIQSVCQQIHMHKNLFYIYFLFQFLANFSPSLFLLYSRACVLYVFDVFPPSIRAHIWTWTVNTNDVWHTKQTEYPFLCVAGCKFGWHRDTTSTTGKSTIAYFTFDGVSQRSSEHRLSKRIQLLLESNARSRLCYVMWVWVNAPSYREAEKVSRCRGNKRQNKARNCVRQKTPKVLFFTLLLDSIWFWLIACMHQFSVVPVVTFPSDGFPLLLFGFHVKWRRTLADSNAALGLLLN